ncbi:zinc knuckle CX2CX4HX4C containing protein, partial [Tanacetum coccineum]
TMAGVDIDTLTMEQYLALSRENQASGMVKHEIGGNVNFEIKSQFMRELREDTFSGNKNEDAHDHIDRVLSIVGLFNILGVSKDADLLKRPLSKGIAHLPRPRSSLKIFTTSHKKETNHYIKPGSGPHLDNDCPLNEEVKQVEEVRYGEFGRITPFNGNNGGKFRIGPPGYYTKTDNHPPYGERRQNLEELLAKHQEESTRRSTEMEVWIKKLQENAEINTRNQNASLKNLETQIEQLTKELYSRDIKSKQAKVVSVEHEGPYSSKKLKNLHGISFLSNSQEENTNDQLPTKESNPRHFTLPYTIGNFNFYAMANLGASVNVLPRNIFEYLELTNLSETKMLVEMADMRKKAPLGIVRDILVKIDKFMFPSDFVILDQTPNSTVNLGRPFLAIVHAQINVFEKEISVGIAHLGTNVMGAEIYGINKLGKIKYWFFPNNNERKEMKGDGVSFPNFLMIRYGSCQVEDSICSKSFIYVSGENNETLSLGWKNGSRFRKMIMEEIKEVLGNDGEDSDDGMT